MLQSPSSVAPAQFVLTGPTGWIGRALLAMLHDAGDPDRLAPGESLTLFGSRACSVATPAGIELPVRPLAQISGADVDGAHVIHLSFLTKDKVEQYGDAEFRRINTGIDDAVLAALQEAHPASVFVASSGAAGLAESGHDTNPYGLAKLEQEARYLNYAQANDVPALCGRIFNIAGPHINKLEAYAVSNFAMQALRGEPIRIEAAIPVFRTFLHVEDLCRMILRSARQRISRPQPIDLCGRELLEMQDIAALVVAEIGDQIAIERPELNLLKKSSYIGDATDSRILSMQLEIAMKAAPVQVRDTVDWIRSSGVARAELAQRHVSKKEV
jgi:nucleoside-diphosphate-sugar epimerase